MIRVLIAEDMRLLRMALTSLLELEADIEVVASLETGDAIVPASLEAKPDVALLDIDLPGTDGISAAEQMYELLPSCRVIIVTNLGLPTHLRRALNARISGFLLKDTPPSRLAASIRAVMNDERVIDPQLALSALESRKSPLTERETQVLRLVAEGVDAPQIARTLFLSPGTVRNYLTTTVNKLRARNRIDAVRIAAEEGWL
ncbi:two-component system response regulator DesR [Nocardiopsis arvandica]|uniref:Two-component system response regulator DesR n=1 Tax=Nocardiopsis sinuspersici TaxID=501010 RepID=A0A7Y9XGZ5_9ACTN|nr:response regulator transcription factor [Nocardiopsis sinuspersici]NYH55646.1 two-component system response regulator DesR [Nocardiopsis sinuspersici]